MIYNEIDCISCSKKKQCPFFAKWVVSVQFSSLKRLFEMEFDNSNCLNFMNFNTPKDMSHDFDIYPTRQIDVTGTWNSKRDGRTFKMYLTQMENTISGNYEYFDGKLEGELFGDELEGTWTQSNGSGNFRFKFTTDGILFLGSWGIGNDKNNNGSWSGTKSLAPTVNVTGLWNTTFNKMYLQQSGNTVTGTFELKNGEINGTIIGDTLVGNWSQDENNDGTPESLGKIKFTFNSANNFKGIWGYNESFSNGGNWSGEKIVPSGSDFIQPITSFGKIDIEGIWDTDFGDLNLKQTGNTVNGTYEFRKGKLDGTITGNTLTGTWHEDTNNNGIYDSFGKFRFAFSPDVTSFKGTWGYKDKFYDGGIWNGFKID